MMGTLSEEKTNQLRRELERKYRENSIDRALESKIWASFTAAQTGDQRRYLSELLDDWEKRTGGADPAPDS